MTAATVTDVSLERLATQPVYRLAARQCPPDVDLVGFFEAFSNVLATIEDEHPNAWRSVMLAGLEQPERRTKVTNGQKMIYDMVTVDGMTHAAVAAKLAVSRPYVSKVVRKVREAFGLTEAA